MKVRLLGGDELARKWYLVVEKVERSLAHGNGDVSAYDIFIECLAAQSQCWIREDEWGIIHGAAITRILTHKQYKECVIVCTTSEGWFDHGPEILEQLEDFARNMGCKYTSVYGRKGWKRALEKYGYKEPFITLMKEI